MLHYTLLPYAIFFGGTFRRLDPLFSKIHNIWQNPSNINIVSFGGFINILSFVYGQIEWVEKSKGSFIKVKICSNYLSHIPCPFLCDRSDTVLCLRVWPNFQKSEAVCYCLAGQDLHYYPASHYCGGFALSIVEKKKSWSIVRPKSGFQEQSRIPSLTGVVSGLPSWNQTPGSVQNLVIGFILLVFCPLHDLLRPDQFLCDFLVREEEPVQALRNQKKSEHKIVIWDFDLFCQFLLSLPMLHLLSDQLRKRYKNYHCLHFHFFGTPHQFGILDSTQQRLAFNKEWNYDEKQWWTQKRSCLVEKEKIIRKCLIIHQTLFWFLGQNK